MAYGEFPLSLPGLIWIVCTISSFFAFCCDIDIGIFYIPGWIVTITGFIYLGIRVMKMFLLQIA